MSLSTRYGVDVLGIVAGGFLAVAAVFVVLFNLLADVLYGVLDPRIRTGMSRAT